MTPTIKMAPSAAEFIREHGGSLYIWADQSGLLHAKTSDPPGSEEWAAVVQVEGVQVRIGESASDAWQWWVDLKHLPWRHLDVSSILTETASPFSEEALARAQLSLRPDPPAEFSDR